MPDRLEPILRKVCQLLAGLLILRVLWVVFRPNPLAHLQIPELPQLADTAAATAAAATNRPAGPPVPAAPSAKPGTNSVASSTGTNTPSQGTNAAATVVNAAGKTNAPSTNQANAKPAPGGIPAMHGMPPGMPPGMAMMGPMMGMPGMPGGRPGGAPGVPLDPLVTARLEKIIQSELLGPVPHPLPASLMGIAGQDAFIRTSSGMSGLIHEGAEFGGMKLLRIGTNRVLVEEGGVKKELTIFGGEGGASLMTP
jgi:hypothetical protein